MSVQRDDGILTWAELARHSECGPRIQQVAEALERSMMRWWYRWIPHRRTREWLHDRFGPLARIKWTASDGEGEQ